MTDKGTRSTPPEPSTLEIYLRGGQTISISVTDWKVKQSSVTDELTELSWTMADGDRMPFVSLPDVVAVIERG